MNQALSGAGLFLVEVIISLATFAFLLRFIVQAVRADFYNPITQAIVRITDPVLKPLRRVVPDAAGLNIAALLVTLLLQIALVFVLSPASPAASIVLATFRTLELVLDIYMFSLFILVILSWIAPGTRHPGADLLHQITEPLLMPFRRLIPPVGGLDFSVMVAILALILVRDFLLPGIAIEIGNFL
jgi:YggT family protein